MGQPAYPPRFIRAGDAPGYLGMCRDEFNKTVRPHVREFPIGMRGVGFDREELDAWADAYVEQAAIELILAFFAWLYWEAYQMQGGIW